jgi:hypothetical protein
LYWSNKIAAHSADAAKQSADVAKQSVELASNTAKKQLQAYIFAIEGQVIGLEGKGPMKIRITINNSGQTPAYETTVEMDTQWEKYPPPPPQAGAMMIKEGARAVLAPGKEFYIEHNVDKPLRQELFRKTVTLQVFGNIHYKDVFGIEHNSSFNFVQGGEYDPRSPLMGIAKSGNSSD